MKKAFIVNTILLIAPLWCFALSQSDYSSIQPDVYTDTPIQTLGTGLTGTYIGYSVRVKQVDGGSSPALDSVSLGAQLEQCDTSFYSSCSVVLAGTQLFQSGTNSNVGYVFSTSTPFTLDPTKYYFIQFSWSTGAFSGNSVGLRGTSFDLYANGSTTATGLSDVYFTFADSTFLLDTTSRFTSLYPPDEDTITNPNISFNAQWFISSDDLSKLHTLFTGPENKIRLIAQIFDYKTSNWSETIIDYTLPTGNEDSTTTLPFLFDGSNSHLAYGHDYKVNWSIAGANYYNIFGPVFTFSTTTYFSVGTTSNSGAIRQAVASSTAEALGSYFNSGYSRNACNPISGDFNITDCALSMFQPDPNYWGTALNKLQTGFLSKPPIGYITRFVSLISATTTVPLPTYTALVRIGESTTTDTIALTYNMQDTVDGAGTILSGIRDPYNGKNFQDVFQPIVQLIVGLALITLIYKDVTGSHKHSMDPAHHTNT